MGDQTHTVRYMIHVSHPQATDGIAVIAGDSNGVSFVIVRNLIAEVSTRANKYPWPYGCEIVHSYECMRRS